MSLKDIENILDEVMDKVREKEDLQWEIEKLAGRAETLVDEITDEDDLLDIDIEKIIIFFIKTSTHVSIIVNGYDM